MGSNIESGMNLEWQPHAQKKQKTTLVPTQEDTLWIWYGFSGEPLRQNLKKKGGGWDLGAPC